MTLDASSHATLADVKREVLRPERVMADFLWLTGGAGLVHCIVGVAWEDPITRYVGHSSRSV